MNVLSLISICIATGASAAQSPAHLYHSLHCRFANEAQEKSLFIETANSKLPRLHVELFEGKAPEGLRRIVGFDVDAQIEWRKDGDQKTLKVVSFTQSSQSFFLNVIGPVLNGKGPALLRSDLTAFDFSKGAQGNCRVYSGDRPQPGITGSN